MKRKILFAVFMITLAAGAFAGWSRWRAGRGLISLDVYQMPLREVLAKVEKQTRRKIHADQGLSTQITLKVKNATLASVLDRIAMQAGARWSTIYAVYQSHPALEALEGVLAKSGKSDAEGWTRLAPSQPPQEMTPEPGGERVFRRGPGGPPPPGGDDGPIRRELPPGGPPGGGRMMVRRSPNDVMMFSNGSSGQVEHWSPTELVAESSITNRFAETSFNEASAGEAQQAADLAKGKWVALIAMRKSIMGVGFAGRGPQGEGNPENRNARFANLTPEQRVQRARDRQQMMVEDVSVIRKGEANEK